MDFVVFSDDWGVHPSSCQHLFKRICIHNRVLWVNTIMRMPSFSISDLKKIKTKITAHKPSYTDCSEYPVKVISPLMIPLFNTLFRICNKLLLRHQLQKALKRGGMNDFILVTTIPVLADIVDNLGARKIVYYCVDEFSEWPGHNRTQMRTMEDKLLSVADVVITTSQTLYESKKHSANKIFCLPHGVDIHHFSESKTILDLKLPHPVIGYYGLFDERNDLTLIQSVLKKRPDWHILIVGEARGDVSALKKYSNITFYGAVPYEQLPAVVRNFDICMLPYGLDKLTENINPLKFKEYLATGIPVVTTALPDLSAYRHIIGWSQTADEFLSNIEFFLKKESAEQKAKRLRNTGQVLQGQSWEDKTEEFLRYIHSS